MSDGTPADPDSIGDLPDPRIVVAALVVSGLGHVIHNLAEFPVEILLGWETIVPVAVTGVLGLAWAVRPRRATFAVMTGWAALVLVVGGGSVLPLGILPFVPDQSVAHYAAHLVYAVAQGPLLWAGIEGARSAPGAATTASSGRSLP